MEEKKRNIPEDILNLELKYLDENVRPHITFVVEAWKAYMKQARGANNIIIEIQALLFQIRPVQRLSEKELEDFENQNKNLQKMLKQKDIPDFDKGIVKLINDINDKIGDCKLFARPSEETSSGLGTLMRQMKKDRKEKNGV